MASSAATASNQGNDIWMTSMPESKVRTISSIINICERTTLNMDKEGVGNAVKAIVIICMKFVDKEALFKAVLPDMYIDWDYIKNQALYQPGGGGKKNFLGDAGTWLHLVQFMDFGQLTLPEQILQTRYPPLHCLYSALQNSGARGKLDFNDACKLLILNNIEGLTSKMMIEHHTSSRMNCNTHAICSAIVSALADERHGADVYEATFRYVLGTLLKVDEKLLAQHMAHYKQTKQDRDKAWVMKAVQSRICRPSMRKTALLMSSYQGSSHQHLGAGGGSDAASQSSLHAPSSLASNGFSSAVVGNTIVGFGEGSGVSCITFEQHSSLVRYPNSMSNLRRLRCYLLASQGHHFPYEKHLEELVPKDVAKALADHPVTIPDANSIYLGIDSLAMNVRPFDEINLFRTRCFISFASHQKRDLSLTQVLKLYVAAYQSKSIWKQLWTSVYPVISPQIIRDVETFVASTQFAVKPFLEILKSSSPF